MKSFSYVQLFATPWTATYQTPPSVGFSRQEYWSGLPLPSPSKCSTWMESQNDRMISVCFQGKPFNITVIQAYVPTSNAESWSWMVLWRRTRPSRANIQKKCPFHYRGLECKSRKSRNTWSNRQIWPRSTEWSRAKANKVLPRECTCHFNNTGEDFTHGHHQMVNTKIRLIIFFAAKDGEALYSQQKQDWELTVTQIMNSLLPNSDLNWRK